MKKFLWLLLLLCNPAWTYAQSYPLYLTDGKSLSRMDLSSLTTTKVADLPPALATDQLRIFYDWTNHFLYAFDGANFWTINKDTAEIRGPFPLPPVPASNFVAAAFCSQNNTFYLIGYPHLIAINASGWEVVSVTDFEPFALETSCATVDTWNETLLVAGWAPTRAHYMPPDRGIFEALSLNLGTPVTEAGFTDYQGNPVLSMTVDPVSGDLFALDRGPFGDEPVVLIRVARGNATKVTQVVQAPWKSITFGEAPSIPTKITLSVPQSIVSGDRTQFVDVTVTAADGSTPTGKVDLTFGGFGTFTHELANGSTQYTLYSLPLGTYQVQASYLSQNGYAVSTSDPQPLTVSAAAIATTLTLTIPSSIVQGDRTQFASIRVTAADGSIPTGCVELTFSGFGTFTHNLSADGTTDYTLYSLPAGTYTLQASYRSQGGFAASQSVVQTLQVTSP